MSGALASRGPRVKDSPWYDMSQAERRAADETLYAHLLRCGVRGCTPAALKEATKDVRTVEAIRQRMVRWSKVPAGVKLGTRGDGAWVAVGATAPQSPPINGRRKAKNAPDLAGAGLMEPNFTAAERARMASWLRDVV